MRLYRRWLTDCMTLKSFQQSNVVWLLLWLVFFFFLFFVFCFFFFLCPVECPNPASWYLLPVLMQIHLLRCMEWPKTFNEMSVHLKKKLLWMINKLDFFRSKCQIYLACLFTNKPDQRKTFCYTNKRNANVLLWNDTQTMRHYTHRIFLCKQKLNPIQSGRGSVNGTKLWSYNRLYEFVTLATVQVLCIL